MSAREDYPALARDAETCSATASQAHRALDEIDRLRELSRHLLDRVALLHDVAHPAWHLMDESGEVPDQSEMICPQRQYERLSDALDALEASGWRGCSA